MKDVDIARCTVTFAIKSSPCEAFPRCDVAREIDDAVRQDTDHIVHVIQRAGARDDVAKEVAARIASAIRPWRIVLFGSRARGGAKDDSDYDFYVEVDAADHEQLKTIEGRIRALMQGIDRLAQLDFKVCPRGDLERRRDDPGTIEWDVAREGQLLYAAPDASTVLAPAQRVREPSPEPPESLHEWLQSAEKDLDHRRLLQAAANDYSPEICWLSHQTCEKHMKALLVSRRVRPARTHNLTTLLESLRKAGVELLALDDDCKLLTKHAITPRYPAGLKLRVEDALAATDAADRVVAAVREHLPRRVH